MKPSKIAQILKERGFLSKDIDSQKMTDEIVEILADHDFFNLIHDEMTLLEEENLEPRNIEEYLEKIGEI